MPDGKWTVDFDDQRCFAARKYQSDRDSLIFGVSLWPMYDWTKVTIEQAGNIDGIGFVHGWLTIGDGEKEHINMLVGPSANEGRVIYTFSIEGPSAAKLRTAREISLRSGSINAHIPLVNLNGVFTKLEECVPLLLEHWGMPQSVQANLSSFPKPATRKYRWFQTSDYPSSAIMRGAVGASRR